MSRNVDGQMYAGAYDREIWKQFGIISQRQQLTFIWPSLTIIVPSNIQIDFLLE